MTSSLSVGTGGRTEKFPLTHRSAHATDSAMVSPGMRLDVGQGKGSSWDLRAGGPVSARGRLMVCLRRHGNAESASQNLPRRSAAGIEDHVPLSGSQGNLYRAVSAGA